MKEKTKIYMWVMVLTAAANILLNFITIPILGFIGALVSTTVSQLIYFVMVYTLSQKVFKVNYPILKIALYLSIIFLIGFLSPYIQIKQGIKISIVFKGIALMVGMILPFVIGLISKEKFFYRLKMLKG